MQEVNFEEAIERIQAQDARYDRDAYLFLRDALDHTQRQIARQAKGPVRHVTPPELLQGVREYALQQFGPMTLTVFGEWGIHAGEDFGEIVFNMVETGLLAKTDKDRRADFAGVYDFDAVFRQPFLPASKLATVRSETKPAGA
jgi:uncharacterized repeat protein (TIGR04138 family)